MAVAIRMPMPGQMTEECTVLQWFKKEGDKVVRGDPLFEIETDKSNMEIEAFDEGVLLRIDAPVGATVPVESIVAWIGQPGEEIPEAVAAGAVAAAAGGSGRWPGALPLPSASPLGASPSQPGASAAAARRHRSAAAGRPDHHQPAGQPGRGGAGHRPAQRDRHRTRWTDRRA